MILMCQCGFIDCNKWTLVGDVDNVRGYACVEAGVHGKPLYFPFHFAVNLKVP